MQNIMRKVIYGVVAAVVGVLCLSSCTYYAIGEHLIVWEVRDGESVCQLEYTHAVSNRKEQRSTLTVEGERGYHYNSVRIQGSGRYDFENDEVSYELERVRGEGEVVMYVLNHRALRTASEELFMNLMSGDYVLTDEDMAWVKENVTAACALVSKEDEDEVVVEL